MTKILLDRSPTGVEHSVHASEHDDEVILERHTPTWAEQDIKEAVHEAEFFQNPHANVRLGAKVPVDIYHAWRQECLRAHGTNSGEIWRRFLKAKLNLPEHKYMRVGGRKL